MLSAFSSRLGFIAPIKPSTEPSSSKSIQIQIPEINYDNTPPQFPLPNSIQRASEASTSTLPTAPTFSFDSPPASDNEEEEEDEQEEGRKGELEAPTTSVKKIVLQKRKKVFVEQGYSQLHWAKLKSSGADLRGGVNSLLRITPSILAQHRTKDDCWQAYNGKVYNVTPFLKYHPGGVPELMRTAGRDGTELFMKTHAWVNCEMMMGENTLVGFLAPE